MNENERERAKAQENYLGKARTWEKANSAVLGASDKEKCPKETGVKKNCVGPNTLGGRAFM